MLDKWCGRHFGIRDSLYSIHFSGGCQPSRHKRKVGGLGIKNKKKEKKKCHHSRELIEEVSITLRREYALMKGVALSPSGKKLIKK